MNNTIDTNNTYNNTIDTNNTYNNTVDTNNTYNNTVDTNNNRTTQSTQTIIEQHNRHKQ